MNSKTRNYWPVNWVDGMKINKSHFQALEAYYNEELALLRQSSLTDMTYGILPSNAVQESIVAEVNTELIRLNDFRAITRGGHLILVGKEQLGSMAHSIKQLLGGKDLKEGEKWMVVLRYHPDERLALGQPDEHETPLRQPYSTVRLSLELMPSTVVATAETYMHAVPLALIKNEYNGTFIDATYVPPAVSTNASTLLTGRHTSWRNMLVAIENNTYEVIRKIKDKHRNETGNQLSADLLAVTTACLRYISSNFDAFRLTMLERSPLYMFTWFAGLARVIRDELRLAEQPENLIGYLAYFIERVSAVQLSTQCNMLCDYAYNHLAIGEGVIIVDDFMRFISLMFDGMKELDYHQIAAPTIIDGSYFNQRENLSRAPTPAKPQAQPRAAMGPMKITVRGRNEGPASSPPSDAKPPADDSGWGLT